MDKKTIISNILSTANCSDEASCSPYLTPEEKQIYSNIADRLTVLGEKLAQKFEYTQISDTPDDAIEYDDLDDGNEPPYCGSCRKHCGTKQIDDGIGDCEFWGARGNHHNIIVVSDCCEADIYEDPELTQLANSDSYYDSEPEFEF